MRSGTHGDLQFWSKSRCFTCKNHWWGLGPMETSYSGANHAVLHVKIDRWGLWPIETCNSVPKVAVLHANTADEGWNPWRLVILKLIKLFCMRKTIGEVWDQWRIVILVLKSLFRMQKYNRCGLGPIETCNSGPKVAVLHSKATNEGRNYRN